MSAEVDYPQIKPEPIMAVAAAVVGVVCLILGFTVSDEMLLASFKDGNDIFFWGGGILLVLSVLVGTLAKLPLTAESRSAE
ncbi:hypothetical protein [Amycolatopsis suaedae]|uniref:Uncharacterized protein n=1 Tax=Amycolatopsis suaedae TaxID=2510978 RepID=A0A4Q7J4C7_9PSEU|nr:hypothetical protein [Amycolatopsis suaedae]RZQ61143.1 hypothetical protein EWH70_25005 [Amycolatopsis suaedae]